MSDAAIGALTGTAWILLIPTLGFAVASTISSAARVKKVWIPCTIIAILLFLNSIAFFIIALWGHVR